MDAQLREWLGLTWADGLTTVSLFTGVAMFITTNPVADQALAGVTILLAIAACPLGMRTRDDLPMYMNVLKLIVYPAYLLLAIGAVLFHFLLLPHLF